MKPLSPSEVLEVLLDAFQKTVSIVVKMIEQIMNDDNSPPSQLYLLINKWKNVN